MTHIRLFEHPADRAKFSGSRALRIDGTLPDGRPGEAYEGRLQISNNIGDCTAWQTGGDDLPPGSTISVDNATDEIVIAWPAYEASAVVIPNAGMEDGNDLGWSKGPGWSVTTDNPITGSYAFQFYQQGGDSYLQSIQRGAITPGTSITASCNVRQGASSKGNAGAGIRLWFYDDGGALLSNPEGNFIATGSNNAIAVSTITTVAPANASTVSIGARGSRKRQNKKVWVDDFAWNLQQPSVGTNAEGDWCITLRARDSAGREADWYGCVTVSPAIVASWNPADTGPQSPTLTNANKTMQWGPAGASCRATIGRLTGKWYYECVVDSTVAASSIVGVGVVAESFSLTNNNPSSTGGAGIGLRIANTSTGYTLDKNGGGFVFGASETWPAGTVIGIAIDLDSGSGNFLRNNVTVNGTTFTLGGNVYFPFGYTGSAAVLSIRMLSSEQTYAPPSGYSVWGGA